MIKSFIQPAPEVQKQDIRSQVNKFGITNQYHLLVVV